jgi:hypothetical protein
MRIERFYRRTSKEIEINSSHAIPDIHPTDEKKFVIPVKTGIQDFKLLLDSRWSLPRT